MPTFSEDSAIPKLPGRKAQNDLNATKAKIAAHLPRLLSGALDSYAAFVATPIEGTPKDFAAHHSACRAALGHLDGLLRLSRWATSDTSTPDEDLTDLLKRAQSAIAESDEGETRSPDERPDDLAHDTIRDSV